MPPDAADAELPLPPRPAGEVIVPPGRPAELRRELRRLEAERDRALRDLGGRVAAMAERGAFSPPAIADDAALARSRQQQIDALTAALGTRARSAGDRASARRATVLAALLAVALLGAVAGAWIQRRHGDAAAAVTVPTVLTEMLTQTVTKTTPAAPSTRRARPAAVAARGGHAVVRRR